MTQVLYAQMNKIKIKKKKKRTGEQEVVTTEESTYLARTSPFTITFLKGGCPKRAVASTNRV
jgi:hypothetical protein